MICMDKKVTKILKQIRPDIDYQNEKKLLSNGVLDSFDFIKIMAAIVEEFGIEIDPMEITIENFDSAESIAVYVLKKWDEQKSEKAVFS